MTVTHLDPLSGFYARLRQVMIHGIWGGLFVNLSIIPLFWLTGIWPLALFSVFSVGFYGLCQWLLRRNYVDLVMAMAFVEVMLHVPAVVITLGWDIGFQYYLIVLIPVIFIAAPRRPFITLPVVLILGGGFIGLDVYCRLVPPWSDINSHWLPVIRYINIVTALSLSGYIGWSYSIIVKRTERNLTVHANTDPLSGLSNRRHLTSVAQKEIARGQQKHQPLSVILCDIDDFKAVNDNYGHDTGDQAIVMVAHLLQAELRSPDLIGRWGGEEFLMVLPNTALELATKVAQRIQIGLAQKYLSTATNDKLPLTMTYGVAELKPGETFDACVNRTDQALYRGKQAGKNRVEVCHNLTVTEGPPRQAGSIK